MKETPIPLFARYRTSHVLGQIVIKNIIGFIDNPWFVWYKYMPKIGGAGRAAGAGYMSGKTDL